MAKTVEITKGTPATIQLHSDTDAAVVTRVAGRSVWVRSVELDESTREGAFPISTVQGDVSKPYGEEERYTLRRSGHYVRAGQKDQRGSVWVTFGRSVRRVNYEY